MHPIRTLCTLLLLVAGATHLTAAPVTPERARAVAVHTLDLLRARAGMPPLPISAVAATAPSESSERPWIYIISVAGEQGFVIVSGDDRAMPLLGYALHGSVATTGQPLPANIRAWLDIYRTQIQRAAERGEAPDPATRAAWTQLERGEGIGLASSVGEVAPLVRTNWDQLSLYNTLCPFDSASGERTPTGCVATAMAQVMKYWNYPEQGEGFSTYAHDLYGNLSASFGITRYRWSEMPESPTEPTSAITTLMYHCGVATQMDYSPVESLTSVIESSTPPLKLCAETALKRFFRYDPATLRGVLRSDYTAEFWPLLLRAELDSARPIIYDGFGDGGGHCFVVDGYQGEYFHINWGWSGSFNGYFLLDALNPDSAAGEAGFNIHQEAIIGIRPPAAGAMPHLRLDAPLLLRSSTIPHNDSIATTTRVVNEGDAPFHGDLCAAAFDTAGNFVEVIGMIRDQRLAGAENRELALDTGGLFRLLPGLYTVALCSRAPGGEWSVLPSTSEHPNTAQITVTERASVVLDRALVIANPDRLQRTGSLDATTRVRNGASTPFRGSLLVRLYAPDGTPAVAVGGYEGIEIPPGELFPDELRFTIDTLDVPVGSYLLALTAILEGSNDTVLVGSGSYRNPVSAIVQAFARDIYEPNNSPAFAAPLAFPGVGTTSTAGANIHIANDSDWYYLAPPAGRNYTLRARVQDALNHDDGNLYTNDVFFHTLLKGDTSEEYDVEMTEPITVQGGDTLYFVVVSYFDGDRGSYRLQVEVVGEAGVEVRDEPDRELRATPNPARTDLALLLPPGTRAHSLSIVDARGTTIRTTPLPAGVEEELTVPLDGIPSGWYTLLVESAQGIYRARFVKEE